MGNHGNICRTERGKVKYAACVVLGNTRKAFSKKNINWNILILGASPCSCVSPNPQPDPAGNTADRGRANPNSAEDRPYPAPTEGSLWSWKRWLREEDQRVSSTDFTELLWVSTGLCYIPWQTSSGPSVCLTFRKCNLTQLSSTQKPLCSILCFSATNKMYFPLICVTYALLFSSSLYGKITPCCCFLNFMTPISCF